MKRRIKQWEIKYKPVIGGRNTITFVWAYNISQARKIVSKMAEVEKIIGQPKEVKESEFIKVVK